MTSHSPRTAPPALTSVFVSPEGVTFITSADQELTLPRPVWTQVGIPMPRLLGMPVTLTVFKGELDAVTRRPGEQLRASFDVYPDTPEGAAVLKALKWDGQVGPPEEE